MTSVFSEEVYADILMFFTFVDEPIAAAALARPEDDDEDEVVVTLEICLLTEAPPSRSSSMS